MKAKLNILMILVLVAPMVGPALLTQTARAAELPPYEALGSVNVTPTRPQLTAVDPMAWGISGDVMPARPFLYSVDQNGITITRFNDNAVVGTWPWPTDVIYTVLPNGGFTDLTPPAEWEPVAMLVSYPTEMELANRVKEIPDLTPPPTYVYVVMAHSGYEWHSISGYRDTIEISTNSDTDSAMLIQIDVSDPSFSASRDPANPVPPHLAGALLGHGAGQPVYDRSTGNVYVGNMPSTSLPAGLTSFVSVIQRIPPEVAEVEAEVPGISIPVIRCGPQHPESGIPVGRPQAFACYDPSGVHPIDDNEHVGAYGEIKQWDTTKINADGTPDLLQEQYVWEFRDLPTWLTPHYDKLSGELDGILYGTPPIEGEWTAEARVHNLGDEFGVFSDWTPIQLLVTPTAEYLPIKAQFAAGVPVAYPLEGTGSCDLMGAPAWVDVQTVPRGCIVMGRAPIDGEYYEFTMGGFIFSGNVFGEYGFVPLPEGVGLSGLAWHQVSKVPDPSTETPVLSLEYIGVEPSTGQLYQILPPPGQPQPPNNRPPETELTLAVVNTEGAPLSEALLAERSDIAPVLVAHPNLMVRFGDVAVEADRDIFVTAGQISDPTGLDPTVIPIGGPTGSTIPAGALMKVGNGTPSVISVIDLPGVQAYSLGLDSDLRTAIIGVEPGQSDHGALWVSGTSTGNVAVVDTALGSVAQTLNVEGASSLGSVSADFATQYAYVAAPQLQSVAIFGPFARPLMEPRIWSAEEFTWNLGQEAAVQLMATGDGIPKLSMLGAMPPGLTFADNGNGTARIYGTPTAAGGGEGGELDVEGGDYAMVVTATNEQGTYAQAFGITIQSPPTITSGTTATFIAGSPNSFTVTGTGYPDPIFYIWDPEDLPVGVQLIDNENGTSSLVGIPEASGTYTFTIYATTDCLPDAEQLFRLEVLPEGTMTKPAITSGNTFTWASVGAPFPPDPFTVSSTGYPKPTLSIEGTLPSGVTFTDNGNSTATLGGTPTTPGIYAFNINATNTEGTATQLFTLNVEVCTSIMAAAPQALSFISDGTFVPAQTIIVTTLGDELPYALVTTASWLSATPEYGTILGTTGSEISVSANAAKLAPGTYTGTVIIGSAGTEGPYATVVVTLTVRGVSEPGVVGIFPSTLNFAYRVNDGTKPPAQTVWVMSGGKALDYTVSTGGAKWLSAPASGTSPGGFRVSVDPRVGVGMHIANLTVDAAGALNGPQTIPVTLVKTAGDKDLIQVMIDVGGSPEGLAANLNTHNLFITSSSAAAEAGGEAEGGPEVELPGPPEPSTVFHINPVDLTLVGEIVVHSEGEYIGVNSKTGRAYHASQGTGEIAVIDGSTNQVVDFIPLTLNGETYQPYQVAIDEAQNLIYVGAKGPEPEAQVPSPLIGPSYGCQAIRELPSDEVPAGQEELDCWHAGAVFVIDGNTNEIVGSFFAGDDPEGVVFAKATGKVYASNEDDGTVTVAKGAKRNSNGSITAPYVLGTIISGKLVSGQWQPTCDANNFCGQRGQGTNLSLWVDPQNPESKSVCQGIDDEAEEADKMAVDPAGNVYMIDDRYRVAKIDGKTDKVVSVLPIPGYDCERSVPDGTEVVFRNTANNIAYMALGQGKLYVTSEQNTVTLIDPRYMTIKATLTIPKAVELDAITTDPALNRVYITDESLASLWILKGACANGVGKSCVP
jgi:DNA-binding beta-propeller fold protein YncE